MDSPIQILEDGSYKVLKNNIFPLGGFTFVPTLKTIATVTLALGGRLKAIITNRTPPEDYTGNIHHNTLRAWAWSIDSNPHHYTKDTFAVTNQVKCFFDEISKYKAKWYTISMLTNHPMFLKLRNTTESKVVIDDSTLPFDHDINDVVDSCIREFRNMVFMYDKFGRRGYGWTEKVAHTVTHVNYPHFSFVDGFYPIFRNKCIFAMSMGSLPRRTTGSGRVLYWWGRPFMTVEAITNVPRHPSTALN